MRLPGGWSEGLSLLQAETFFPSSSMTCFASSTPAAEGDHDDQVYKPHLLPDPLHRPALEAKPLPVALIVVAGGAAEPEHRVCFLWLEVGPAEKACILVGLEVAHPDDDRVRVERRGDGPAPSASLSTKYSSPFG